MLYHLFNIFVSALAYFGVFYFHSGYIYLHNSYSLFFPIYLAVSFLFSIYFTPKNYVLKDRTQSTILQFIFTIFSLSLVVSLSDYFNIPRYFIFLVVVVPVAIRWLMGFYHHDPNKIDQGLNSARSNFQFKRLSTSFILLILAFIIALYFKTGRIGYYIWLEKIVLLLIGLWWVSSHVTRKFYALNDQNIYYKIAPIIKSQALFLLFSPGIYYFFKLDFLSRQLFFGTIGVFSLFETTVFLILFMNRKSKSNLYTYEPYIMDQNIPFIPDANGKVIQSFAKSCLSKMHHFIKDERLIRFIDNTYKCTQKECNLDSFLYLTTKKLENFQGIKDESQCILVNITSINNILSINPFLLTMRQKIQSDGVLVGSFSPMEEDYKRLRDKMPRFLYTLIIPLHFLLYRIFPKIPIISIVYDFITQGRGRFLSKAEVYGRLSYCGFKLMDSIMIDHKLFFIAQRKESISTEPNPSFGPLVKLKRVGYENEIVTIYKFRTMHPYSEFIQKDLFDKNSLTVTGKFKDDFRITSWGKVFRKLWIDELPQIYNWLRGDISLIGVRALSQHYFSLYPKDLQKLRVQFKPGLIPPYYADMPKNFDEIILSEKRYLNKKIQSGFLTDLIYFLNALNNIVFKGARSQ